MPTRKQRRRRQKDRRHEYEEVYLDADGNEITAEEYTALARSENGDGAGPRKREPAKARTRSGRVIQPPSWRRVGKRALIFAPLMFVVISLLPTSGGDLPVLGRVLITLQMLLLFIPFSYLMDTLTYRMWRRRNEREAGAKR